MAIDGDDVVEEVEDEQDNDDDEDDDDKSPRNDAWGEAAVQVGSSSINPAGDQSSLPFHFSSAPAASTSVGANDNNNDDDDGDESDSDFHLHEEDEEEEEDDDDDRSDDDDAEDTAYAGFMAGEDELRQGGAQNWARRGSRPSGATHPPIW